MNSLIIFFALCFVAIRVNCNECWASSTHLSSTRKAEMRRAIGDEKCAVLNYRLVGIKIGSDVVCPSYVLDSAHNRALLRVDSKAGWHTRTNFDRDLFEWYSSNTCQLFDLNKQDFQFVEQSEETEEPETYCANTIESIDCACALFNAAPANYTLERRVRRSVSSAAASVASSQVSDQELRIVKREVKIACAWNNDLCSLCDLNIEKPKLPHPRSKQSLPDCEFTDQNGLSANRTIQENDVFVYWDKENKVIRKSIVVASATGLGQKKRLALESVCFDLKCIGLQGKDADFCAQQIAQDKQFDQTYLRILNFTLKSN